MFSKIWRFLSSVRLALVLILVIAGLCLVGALLVQAPQDIGGNSEAYHSWLKSVAEPRFGIWTSPLRWLDLFNVFRSPLFLVVGLLFITNIIACSIKRWKNLSKETTLSTTPGDEFYKSSSGSTEFTLQKDLSESAELIRGVLKKNGYRSRTVIASSTAYINADKNRLSRYGTLFSHLSLILFIVGFLVGSWFGFKDTSFIVSEGTTRQVGHGTGLALTLDSFTDEYWPDGMPKDFRSDVELLQNGEQVDKGSIRVNHPMLYNGVNFYQSSFGPAALIEVRGPSDQVIFRDAIALSSSSQISGFMFDSGSFDLADQDLSVQLVGSDNRGIDPPEAVTELAVQVKKTNSTAPLAMDIIEKGTPHDIAGLQFTYIEKLQYSGFQVSRDPGNVLIWIASAILLVGLVLVLYFSYHRVWVQVQTQRGNAHRIRLRMISPRSQNIDSEIAELRKGIEKAIE